MISNKDTLDLGRIREGALVTNTIMITNNVESDIDIIGTRASCGCTAPTLEKGLLKSGDNRTVTIIFNSTGKRGDNFKQIFIDYIENGETKVFVQNFKCSVI